MLRKKFHSILNKHFEWACVHTLSNENDSLEYTSLWPNSRRNCGPKENSSYDKNVPDCSLAIIKFSC